MLLIEKPLLGIIVDIHKNAAVVENDLIAKKWSYFVYFVSVVSNPICLVLLHSTSSTSFTSSTSSTGTSSTSSTGTSVVFKTQ
jgi:hypothetical protein